MKSIVEWKTASGATIKVTVGLVTKKDSFADGYNIEVDCCDKTFEVEFDGKRINTCAGLETFGFPRKIQGHMIYGCMGKLFLSNENKVEAIKDAIAKIESTPEWQAKVAKEEKNISEVAEMEAKRRANGYCEKCGSYCYGDCEAN